MLMSIEIRNLLNSKGSQHRPAEGSQTNKPMLYQISYIVLSNCLKIILPDIISLNHSAFVPGHMITDNVSLAYELTQFMQTKRGGGRALLWSSLI